jgi:hypothetical protein
MDDAFAPRSLLLGSVAFAVARLPKGLLQRLQREHVKDEAARLAAEDILRHLELSYRVMEQELVRKPPAR